MSNNKLNLLVQFTGVDKMSASLRNIMGGSKDATQSIRDMKREVRLMEKDLARVNREMGKGGGAGLSMAQRELTDAIKRTNAEIDKQVSKAERLANIQNGAKSIASKAGAAGAAATVAVTAPLVAFGRAAFTAAMNAEELDSAFNVTFGKNSAAMDAWAQKTAGAIGRTEVELKDAANTFGIFFNQADPAKSAALSQQFSMLAQDLASFYNVDPGTAMQKLRSGLTGESEPLRDFGVFMTEAAVKAQALKMGLKPVNGELTEQQKIMARAGLIMAQTSAAQGDLDRTSDSTSNKLRASQAAWENLQLVVGQQLIPAIAPLIGMLTNLLSGFSQMSPETQKWIVILGAGAALLGPVLLGIAGIASAVGMAAGALPILGAAFGFLFSPVGLLIAAFAALGYAIYANWDSIKATISEGVNWIKGVFSSLPGTLSSIGSQMMQGLLIAINPVALGSKLIEMAKNGISAFKSYLGIKSPSRLFMQMGEHVNAGLGIGLERTQDGPVRAISRMAGAVAGAGAMALSPLASANATPMARSASAVIGSGGMALPAAVGARTLNAPSQVTINVTQQPGENAEALAQRVAQLVERAQRQKGLRSYEDRL